MKYLVFIDNKGYVIGRPTKVYSPEEASGAMENHPVGAVYQTVDTKEKLLAEGYGLVEEDFKEELCLTQEYTQ